MSIVAPDITVYGIFTCTDHTMLSYAQDNLSQARKYTCEFINEIVNLIILKQGQI